MRTEPRNEYDNEYNLTPEQLNSLDPRIREWVTNPNYTVASRERDASSPDAKTSSSMVERHSEGPKVGGGMAKQTGAARRSADGVVTVRDAPAKDPEPIVPELLMLKRLGMHMPLRYKDKFRSFWPASISRTKAKRLEVNPMETYKLLQHYQMRLSLSSGNVLDAQDVIHNKISVAEHSLWSSAQQLAATGLAMNKLEIHASEAWNIEKQLLRTRQKLGAAIQSIDRLLSSLPPELVDYLGRPSFTISPLFTNNYYLKLNYWSLTPYAPETPQFYSLELEWLTRILPYWDVTIGLPTTKALWRQGIPPRLRAYIWQNAIGNRLFLTREMYHQHLQTAAAIIQSDPIYDTVHREQASGTEIASADGTIEIDLTDPSDSPSSSSIVPSASSIRTREVLLNEVAAAAASAVASSSTGSAASSASIGSSTASSTVNLDDKDISAPIAIPSIQRRRTLEEIRAEEIPAPGSPARAKRTRELVIRDSLRTFSKLGIYRKPRTPPHEDLVAVLHAVATARPDLSYVQGQSFLAAALLLYMPADEAFVTLANLLDSHFFKSFFANHDLDSIRLHTSSFEALLEQNLPMLSAHFKSLNLAPELYLFDWYVTLFSKPLPPPVSGVIWDCYFLEGPQFIPLFTCAILKQYQSRLLQFNFEECMKLLQQLPDDFNVFEILAELDSLPSSKPASLRSSLSFRD